MNSNYIKSIFDHHNIETLLPSKKDMLFIDSIRKQIYEEIITKELLDKFNAILESIPKIMRSLLLALNYLWHQLINIQKFLIWLKIK